MESDGPSCSVGQKNRTVPIGQGCFKEAVTFTDVDRFNTILSWTAVSFQARFLYLPLFGCHNNVVILDVLLILKGLDRNKGFNTVILGNFDQIHNGSSAGESGSFRYLIHFQPVTVSLLGKEEDVVMVGSHEEMFYIFIVPGSGAFHPFTSPALTTITCNRHAFDKAFVGDGYHHIFRSEEHTSELQSRGHLVCRLLPEKKNHKVIHNKTV